MTTTPVRRSSTGSGVDTTPVQTNEAKLKKRVLRKNIKEILLRFKFSDLITDVILELFDLEHGEVNQKLKEYKLPSNKASVATLLSCRSQAFTVQELEDMSYSLQLYKTAFGSKQKKWVTVSLLEPTEDHSFSEDENVIRINLLQGLRIKGLSAVVKVITHEELIWVIIIEKKLTRRRGIKLLTPIFLCYEVGLPYIFTASKISAEIMESILRAMKYKKHKPKQLEGKDIKSLLALLKHKATNRDSAVVPYTQQGQITLGYRFIDVSCKKARESYINRVFDTKDPISLETFQVNAETMWRDDSVPEMIGVPFQVSLTLKSKDLVGMVKHMASNNIVTTPLPVYLQEIVRSAKNKVSMKTVESG